MSRCSKYNQQDVERMAAENGFEYVSGVQMNQESEHKVRCRTCGLPDTKTTKMLIANSKCRYMPCKTRGVLTLQYIQKTVEQHGIKLVNEPEPFVATIISGDDKLLFIKDKKLMSERWKTIKERIRVGRSIFVEGTEHQEKNHLTDEKLNKVMQVNCLALADSQPTHWSDKVRFKCLRCGMYRYDTPKRLSAREECDCECVKSKKRFNDFVSRVENAGFAFDDLNRVRNEFQTIAQKNVSKRERENEYRRVRAQLKCPCCREVFRSQCLYQIAYHFLLFCTNRNCESYIAMRAKSESLGLKFCGSAEALESNAVLLTSSFRNSFHFRLANPYAFYRLTFGKGAKGLRKRCSELNDGWATNQLCNQTDDAISRVVASCIKNGAISGLKSLLEAAPNADDREFIERVSQKFRAQFRACCEKLNYALQNDWRNITVEHAVREINRLELKNRNEFKYKSQGLYGACIRKNLLTEIYEALDWPAGIRYVDMSDDELLAHSKTVATDLNVRNITELEYVGSSALVREIRSENRENVSEKLHAIMSWDQAERWRGIEIFEIFHKLHEHKIYSMTDLHKKLPGLYKYLGRVDMLKIVESEMSWGIWKSVRGKKADSLVEAIVFSLMELNDIHFQTHSRTPFKGRKNTNAMKADFILENDHNGRQIYGEVWACSEQYPGSGFLQNYLINRRYKESQYERLHHVELLSIEGIEYYKPTQSLTRYVRHIAKCFASFGIKLDAGQRVTERIRESLMAAIYQT